MTVQSVSIPLSKAIAITPSDRNDRDRHRPARLRQILDCGLSSERLIRTPPAAMTGVTFVGATS
jgi:hypothetical protein